uniref:Uncharacterized protein n=1 Tax=Arundo donax TaxID=35708 RepID=A0A0A8YWP4_ARUDO
MRVLISLPMRNAFKHINMMLSC